VQVASKGLPACGAGHAFGAMWVQRCAHLGIAQAMVEIVYVVVMYVVAAMASDDADRPIEVLLYQTMSLMANLQRIWLMSALVRIFQRISPDELWPNGMRQSICRKSPLVLGCLLNVAVLVYANVTQAAQARQGDSNHQGLESRWSFTATVSFAVADSVLLLAWGHLSCGGILAGRTPQVDADWEEPLEVQTIIVGNTTEHTGSGAPPPRSGDNCAICLSEMEEGKPVGRLQCGHCFHEPCVKRWLKVRNRCPLRCMAPNQAGAGSGEDLWTQSSGGQGEELDPEWRPPTATTVVAGGLRPASASASG